MLSPKRKPQHLFDGKEDLCQSVLQKWWSCLYDFVFSTRWSPCCSQRFALASHEPVGQKAVKEDGLAGDFIIGIQVWMLLAS